MNCVNSFAFDFGGGKPARRLGIDFHAVNGTLFTNYNKDEVVPTATHSAVVSVDPASGRATAVKRLTISRNEN
jgi:hypothetical protein